MRFYKICCSIIGEHKTKLTILQNLSCSCTPDMYETRSNFCHWMLPKLQLCFWTIWKMQYYLINKYQELNSRKTTCNNAKDLIQNGIMCHHQYMCIKFANFTFTSQVLLKSESAQLRPLPASKVIFCFLYVLQILWHWIDQIDEYSI